jgi:O-antigen/teichoic acid export membrane protein
MHSSHLKKYIKKPYLCLLLNFSRLDEKEKKAFLTTLTGVIFRIVSILLSIISIPITLKYLGIERYGMWMTISSVTLLFGFMDLGLGSALINLISISKTAKNDLYIRKRISNVYLIIFSISICIVILNLILYFFIPWNLIYNVKSSLAVSESAPATFFLIFSFIVSYLFGITQKVQAGYQQEYIFNLWQILGAFISFIFLLIVIQFQGGLTSVIFSITGIPALVSMLNFVYFFYKKNPSLSPSLHLFDYTICVEMLKKSSMFLMLWFVNFFGYSIDRILIAHFDGPEGVASFSIVERIFSITSLIQLYTLALWPAFSSSVANKEFIWIRELLIKMLQISTAFSILICTALYFSSQFFITKWLGSFVAIPGSLILSFTIYKIFLGISDAFIPLMATDNYIKKLLKISIISSFFIFFLKLVSIAIWKTPASLVWASAIGFPLFFTAPLAYTIFKSTK